VKRLVLALLVVLSITGPADAETGPDDFARVMPLVLSGEGALYELRLPAEVYVWTRRPDLGDLAVFNARGEVVPFSLLVPALRKADPVGKPLPAYPLSRGRGRQPGGIALEVHTNGEEARVRLDAAPGKAPAGHSSAYLVDAGSREVPVAGFDLVLTPGGQQYLGTLRVETSDDLQVWREHATGAIAVLSSGEGEGVLNRDRIEFPAVRARYFRLSLCPEAGTPRVESVSARVEPPATAEKRATAGYQMTPVPGKSGEYTARTSGHMPVDRMRLVFQEENSLAGVTFFSRPDRNGPWIQRGCGTFYRLRRGAKLFESPPLELAPVTDREWLIRVQHPTGGLPGVLPQLEVGWQPHRLIFLARGNAPYRLAYGSCRIRDISLRDDGVAAQLRGWEERQIRPLAAQAGPSVEAGGRRALRPRVPATTWRKALLWAALCLGVLLLARMAWQLAHEMGLAGSKKND
jgi:hypothetical protein